MKRDYKLISCLLLFIPLLLLNIVSVSKATKQIYFSLTSPFIKRADSTIQSFSDFSNRILFSNEILKENREFKKEIRQLKTKMVSYKELEDENQRLKDILCFKKNLTFPTIPCKVIGRDITALRQSLIIDKGKEDGIEKDSAVVCYYGLVGKVVEVGPTISKVMLLTDIDFKVSVMLQNGRHEGIMEGSGRTYAWLKYVRREADINKNDIVISSGLGGVIPKGIIIGGVVSAEKTEESLFKKIKIEPAVDFSKLEEVLVISSCN